MKWFIEALSKTKGMPEPERSIMLILLTKYPKLSIVYLVCVLILFLFAIYSKVAI